MTLELMPGDTPDGILLQEPSQQIVEVVRKVGEWLNGLFSDLLEDPLQ